MTKPLTSPHELDARRLPDGQLDWARSVVDDCSAVIDSLVPDERALYAAVWNYLARHHAPATLQHFPQLNLSNLKIQQFVDSLNDRKLLWYDNDLRAILQCPPFSVLHTAHRVKAFGWESIYASSFIDIPITLLIYGPNVWLNVNSICPRSGETLNFRVKMREDHTLVADPPLEADQWRIWLPMSSRPMPDTHLQFHRIRTKINAFRTIEDLETHRHYLPNDPPGAVYTLEQSLYLSSLLLMAYSRVLSPA